MPAPLSSSHRSPPLRVAVDLSKLRPGGENGGIKPFLFETLLWLGSQERVPLHFIYLTCTSTHADVRDDLARVNDELVCVHDDGPRPRGDERAPRERLEIPPSPDLLWRLGARVLYCPFGPVDLAQPGISTICTVVDVLHRDFPGSLGTFHNGERERIFQGIVAVADAIQCNSQHVVARMRAHYDVPAERLFTVYNAVHRRFASLPTARGDASEITGRPPRLPEGQTPRAGNRSGRPANEDASPFFFYPANAWRHKNHEVLLVAYGLYRAGALAAGLTPWPLVLTGHEDARWEQMRALAQTLGLLGDDAARFAGYMPPAEFARLWDTAGALVFPSLHEGFGIPLLEAMQHDVPVLCSGEGSLPEVGADACLFVDARRPEALADGMTRLATDPALRQRLVEAGRRRRADFSQDHEAGRLLDVIVALANTTPPYRPFHRGIFPDGWTEPAAMFTLPDGGDHAPGPGTLTLRFLPMPAPRRVRLRTTDAIFGGFDLVPDRLGQEIALAFRPRGGALWLDVPNAANLNAADARVHGVHLVSADLRLADGQNFSLFAAR